MIKSMRTFGLQLLAIFWAIALAAFVLREVVLWRFPLCDPKDVGCSATLWLASWLGVVAVIAGVSGLGGLGVAFIRGPRGKAPWRCRVCGEVFYQPDADAINTFPIRMGARGIGVGMVGLIDAVSGGQRCPRCGSDRFRAASDAEIDAARASGRLQGEMPWMRKSRERLATKNRRA